ncbi:MAG: iron-sulfur cluster assembly scaffold protein [Tagaea sp.]|nr:iron-sulfur cluster assembly scaffold protein [Tagaea sp.]
MSDALYHDALMALAKDATYAAALGPKDGATVDNPLCGDRVTLAGKIESGVFTGLKHRVRGCALCQAATAALARALDAKPMAALAQAEAALESALAGGAAPEPWAAFAPVGRHKSRHDCVRLPFSAAKALISGT